MRPIPIPDAAIWDGARRVVFAAPGGDLLDPNIAPVEALVDHSDATGTTRVSVMCQLEDGDLVKLAEGGHVWVSFYGGLPPFSVDVTGPIGEVIR